MVFGGSHGGNLTGRSGPTGNTGEKPEATEPTCRTVMASSSKASNVLTRIPSASMRPCPFATNYRVKRCLGS